MKWQFTAFVLLFTAKQILRPASRCILSSGVQAVQVDANSVLQAAVVGGGGGGAVEELVGSGFPFF